MRRVVIVIALSLKAGQRNETTIVANCILVVVALPILTTPNPFTILL